MLNSSAPFISPTYIKYVNNHSLTRTAPPYNETIHEFIMTIKSTIHLFLAAFQSNYIVSPTKKHNHHRLKKCPYRLPSSSSAGEGSICRLDFSSLFMTHSSTSTESSFVPSVFTNWLVHYGDFIRRLVLVYPPFFKSSSHWEMLALQLCITCLLLVNKQLFISYK